MNAPMPDRMIEKFVQNMLNLSKNRWTLFLNMNYN